MVAEKVESLTMQIMDRLRKNSAVRMKDPATVQAKIQKIINDGYDKLLVISDFDYTLSRYRDADEKRCLTTHGIFDECARQLNPELADKRVLISEIL
uniref:5'-nucleotidase n=1 Tax=Panagrolaimus superbus TaxID=310955 RepID=A0A914YDQ0_9BILA